MKINLKLGVFAFGILMVFVLVGCDLLEKDAMDYYQDVKSTDLSTENVDTISIHSDESALIDAFGKPFQVEELTTSEVKNVMYQEIEFGVSGGKVFRYYFGSDYETAEHIKNGDQKEKVIAAYGESYYERSISGTKEMGYFDKDNQLTLKFGLNDNKVSGIVMEKLDEERDD